MALRLIGKSDPSYVTNHTLLHSARRTEQPPTEGASREERVIAGVELGGTKCVCTLARASGDILSQVVIPTTLPAETLSSIEDVLTGWWAKTPFEMIGIGSFGPVDLNCESSTYGTITSTAKNGWVNTDVLGGVARKFSVPTMIETDVNAAALAEMRWGAARGLRDIAYITVGTGVGVGLIMDGKPVHGFSHGELGHIRVPRLPGDMAPGVCPYHGDCVEGLASGTAVRARYGAERISVLQPDDPLWDTVAHTIAQLCHVLVCTTAPRKIMIGGGVFDAQPHLLPRIEPLLIDSLAGYVTLPEGPYIVAPGLGKKAGQLGPIALASGVAESFRATSR